MKKKIALVSIALLVSDYAGGAFGHPNDQFADICKEAGVRFIKHPSSPVRSVAFTWSSDIHRQLFHRYELNAKGKTLLAGSLFWSPHVEDYTDFIEEKIGPESRFGPPGVTNAKYAKKLHDGSVLGEESLSADVEVKFEVSNPAELDKPVRMESLIKYTVTVLDRRTSEKLATMVYWVDGVNRRACGTNLKDTIDVDVFVLEATAIPITIPAWEIERRGRALIPNSPRWEPKSGGS